MFNSNPFGSFGAKPAATTSPFGQPATGQTGGLFGATNTTSGFSGFGGFGSQPSTTTQPQTSSPFGGFGAQPSTTTQTQTSSPFGSFGSSAAPPTTSQTSSPFGGSGGLFGSNTTTQPQTQSTFGSFGSAQPQTQSTFGSFGGGATTQPQSSSPFGFGGSAQPQTQSSPFSLTSTTQTSTPFGAPTTNSSPFGTQTAGGFGSFNQNNTLGTPTPHQNTSIDGCTLISITGMPCYSTKSFEELRYEDITHRKDAVYKTGASGATSSFGQGGFGSTTTAQPTSSLFGTSTTPTSSGLFGQAQQSTSPFGTPTTTAQTSSGLFGASTTPTTGGLFGQTQQSTSPFGTPTTTAQTSSGLFGAPTTPTTSGLFVQTQNTQPSSGLFGQTQQSTSPFGQTQAASPFGQTQTTNPTTSLFSQNPTTSTAGSGLFGQPTQPTSTNSTTSLFGQNPTTSTAGSGLFGSGLGQTTPTTGGLFGQNPSTTTNSGGLFSATAAPSPFGQTTSTTQTSQTGGLFGLGQTTPSSTTSPFGQTPTSQTSTGGGLFGLGQTSQTGGLFGSNTAAPLGGLGSAQPSTTTSGGLFGSQQTSGLGGALGSTQPSTGLFGAQPSTTGLGSAQPSTGLFGAQPSTTSTGLFGQPTSTGLGGLGTQPTSTGLFSAQPSTSTGLFGLGTQPTSTGLGGLGTQPSSTGLFGATPTTTSSLFSSNPLQSTIQQPALQQPTLGQPTLQQTTLQQPQVVALQQSQVPLNNSINSANPYFPIPQPPPFATLVKQPPTKVITPPSYTQRPLSHHGYIPRSTTKLVPRRLGPNATEDLGFSVLPNPKGLFPIDKFVSKHSKSLNINTSNETEESLKQNYATASNGKQSISSASSNYTDNSGPNTLSSVINYQPPPLSSAPSSNIPRSTSYYDPFEQQKQQQEQEQYERQQEEQQREQYEKQQQKKQKEQEKKKQQINSKAPKLTLEGYETEPSIEQLQKCSDEELKHVRYFTIKRPGYGKIVFQGEVNVLGLNLDEIVEIDNRAVTVYKDEHNKPEVGEGLNIPADISLENCYPKNKNGDRITELKPLERYENALRKNCEINDCTFISYDKAAGLWVFKAKHFSRYSIEDYDEDDLLEMEEQLKKQTQQHQQKSVTFQKPTIIPSTSTNTLMKKSKPKYCADDINYDSDSDNQSVDEDMMVPQKKYNKTPFVRRVNNDASGLFETSSYVPYDRSEGIAPKIQRVVEPNLTISTTNKPAVSFNESIRSPFVQSQYQQQKQQQSIFKPSSTIISTPPALITPKSLPPIIPTTNSLTQYKNYSSNIKIDRNCLDRIVPKEESIIEQLKLKANNLNATQSSTKDPSIFMRRSFRVGWAPGGNFIIPSKNSIKTLHIKKIPTDVKPEKKESLLSFLKEHLSNSSLVPEENKSIGWFSLSQIQNQMEQQLRLQLPSTEQSVYYKRIWSLILTLWGIEKSNKYGVEYTEQTIRKLNLNQWLKDFIDPITRDELEKLKKKTSTSTTNYLEKIFLLLCSKQVKEASSIAIENKDFRLATMISQVWSSNQDGKILIEKQLELYQEIGANQFINEKRLEILKLISGNVDAVYKNLNDWLRCFAIIYWFRFSFNLTTIEHSIDLYEQSFNGHKSIYPLPPYQSNNNNNNGNTMDICFLLLKLFSSNNLNSKENFQLLRNIFYPENVGKDLLDYQLSWNLYTVLKAIPQLSRQSEISNSSNIHSSFSAQLERLGLWQWSIYVLLHMPDHSNYIREEAVKSLISRNITKITESDKSFLIDKLNVPKVWIDEALAWFVGYDSNCDVFDEIESLFKSYQYSKIHSLVFNTIGPNFIITNRYSALKTLLNKLEPHASTISTWRYGGQIFYDFIKIDSEYKEALSKLSTTANEEIELSKCYLALRVISSNINNLLNDISKLSQSSEIKNTTSSYKHSLSFMSESLITRSTLLKNLPENTTVKLNTTIGSLISTINSLPLTQSYRSKNLDSLSIQIQDSLLKSIYNKN